MILQEIFTRLKALVLRMGEALEKVVHDSQFQDKGDDHLLVIELGVAAEAALQDPEYLALKGA